MRETSDVIVVGGGIVGSSIAFHLAKRGLRVTLVEKNSIASGPTGRSGAIIRQHYSNPVTAKMALRSLRIWQNFGEAVGGTADFRQTGYMMGARPEDLEGLKANIAMQQKVGINTRFVSREEIGELEYNGFRKCSADSRLADTRRFMTSLRIGIRFLMRSQASAVCSARQEEAVTVSK